MILMKFLCLSKGLQTMNAGWVHDEVSMSWIGYMIELYEMELVQDEVSMRLSEYRMKRASFRLKDLIPGMITVY